MSHKALLQMLSTLELNGVFMDDLTIEGAALDTLVTSADALLDEMYPDTTSLMIDRWEARLGIATVATDSLQIRRNRVVAKWRSRGGLSVPFFLQLGADLGYTISIEECVGGNPNVWRVVVSGQATYQFTAGESAAGDSLLSWDPADALEGMFNDLKPATSRIIFEYL